MDSITDPAVAGSPGSWYTQVTGRLNALSGLYAYKAADETLGNITVYQNDDHLYIPVAANTEYFGEALLIVASDSAADFKYQLTLPTGATLLAHNYLTTNPVAFAWATTAEVSIATLGAASPQPLRTWFSFVTGTSAGYLRAQWAKFAGHASTTTVIRGSNMRIWPATIA